MGGIFSHLIMTRYLVRFESVRFGSAPGTRGAVYRRVHFLPPLDAWDYFALLGVADVVLDPFPVGNLHAAVDAFALGTPVVTLPSRQRPGAR